MDRDEILSRLQDIFRDVFADDALLLGEQTDASDIDAWDSLMHITILESVRDEFSITFDLDEMVGMENVGDMVDAIEKKLSAGR